MQLGLGLGLRDQAIRALRRAMRWERQRPRHPLIRQEVERLHIGSGPLVRPGWTNVDLDAHPGVEYVLDVRRGLPFKDAHYIFAEHFLEHLTYDEGIAFLRECRDALRDDGVLRLSTPNLDWVWITQYRTGAGLRECFGINKAFHGWGHQFLYNLETLTATLHAAGFADVRQCRYGESTDPALTGLERHERDVDTEALPHVIIVEVRGRAEAEDGNLREILDDFDWAMHP